MEYAVSKIDEPSLERKLENSGKLTIIQATSMKIENAHDYEQAGKFLVEVKARAKAVKDYWETPKAIAKAAHQAVVDREKAMLAPLAEAERMIKGSMIKYQKAVEAARRDAEEQARKRRMEETERLIQNAIDASDSGNKQDAEINLAMAEMVDQMAVSNQVCAPSASGTSVIKTWKARVIDECAVPSYANGFMIRKIDFSALNSIARLTRGTAIIPGVEFYQEINISAKS